jgi:hypothetical protein
MRFFDELGPSTDDVESNHGRWRTPRRSGPGVLTLGQGQGLSRGAVMLNY